MPETKIKGPKRKKELIMSIPKILVYGGVAIVIWLFSQLIFIPLGKGIVLWENIETTDVIVVAAIVAILGLTMMIFREIRNVCDALAAYLTVSFISKPTEADLKAYKNIIRPVIYVLAAAVIYLFFGSLLINIHPALSGILLVAIFIWAILILYSGARTISHRFEASAREVVEEVIETSEGELAELKGEEEKKK